MCEEKKGNKRRPPLLIYAVSAISVLYLAAMIYLLTIGSKESCNANGIERIYILDYEFLSVSCRQLGLNEIGDYFAGAMSFISTVWLITAFVWQAKELAFQRREFQKTNEITLSRQQSELKWQKTQTILDLLRIVNSNKSRIDKIIATTKGGVFIESPTTLALMPEYLVELQGQIVEVSAPEHADELTRCEAIRQENLKLVNLIMRLQPNSEFS